MKIICLIDSLGSGGAQRQITELAKGFKISGADVEVVIYHNNLFYAEELISNGVKIIPLIEKSYFKRIVRIAKYIRKSKPDVVLSFLQTPSFIATISSLPFRNWKLIVGERNADPAILKSYKEKFYRLFHIFADYVVGNSQTNINLVTRVNPFIKKEKLKVIYNITNINYKNYMIDNNFLIRDKLKIVIAGRYEYQKNYLTLIDAINSLPDIYKNQLEISCYGSIQVNNSYYNACVNKINEYNLNEIIILNNSTKQILKEYAKSDFVGLFSHFEGFPNAICEAMSLKKPVIVTKVSDIPILLKDNVNGYLCESDSIISIQNAIIKGINSSREERDLMGVNNYNLCVSKFDREIITKSYMYLFD
jgi:glycosyltransferase involved in cell wall biosynthesis